jgi:hypothetical protein
METTTVQDTQTEIRALTDFQQLNQDLAKDAGAVLPVKADKLV